MQHKLISFPNTAILSDISDHLPSLSNLELFIQCVTEQKMREQVVIYIKKIIKKDELIIRFYNKDSGEKIILTFNEFPNLNKIINKELLLKESTIDSENQSLSIQISNSKLIISLGESNPPGTVSATYETYSATDETKQDKSDQENFDQNQVNTIIPITGSSESPPPDTAPKKPISEKTSTPKTTYLIRGQVKILALPFLKLQRLCQLQLEKIKENNTRLFEPICIDRIVQNIKEQVIKPNSDAILFHRFFVRLCSAMVSESTYKKESLFIELLTLKMLNWTPEKSFSHIKPTYKFPEIFKAQQFFNQYSDTDHILVLNFKQDGKHKLFHDVFKDKHGQLNVKDEIIMSEFSSKIISYINYPDVENLQEYEILDLMVTTFNSDSMITPIQHLIETASNLKLILFLIENSELTDNSTDSNNNQLSALKEHIQSIEYYKDRLKFIGINTTLVPSYRNKLIEHKIDYDPDNLKSDAIGMLSNLLKPKTTSPSLTTKLSLYFPNFFNSELFFRTIHFKDNSEQNELLQSIECYYNKDSKSDTYFNHLNSFLDTMALISSTKNYQTPQNERRLIINYLEQIETIQQKTILHHIQILHLNIRLADNYFFTDQRKLSETIYQNCLAKLSILEQYLNNNFIKLHTAMLSYYLCKQFQKSNESMPKMIKESMDQMMLALKSDLTKLCDSKSDAIRSLSKDLLQSRFLN